MTRQATDWLPASKVGRFDPRRFDFVWNDNYTQFRALPLSWWDDVSYASFQCQGLDG